MVNYDIAYSKVAYKYLFKAFYNTINKKEYDSQIWQKNIRHTNLIAIKNLIAIAKKDRKNRELLVIENKNKTAMVKVAKVSSVIDLGNKYSWVISNINIEIARDSRLTSIKQYWKCIGQI